MLIWSHVSWMLRRTIFLYARFSVQWLQATAARRELRRKRLLPPTGTAPLRAHVPLPATALSRVRHPPYPPSVRKGRDTNSGSSILDLVRAPSLRMSRPVRFQRTRTAPTEDCVDPRQGSACHVTGLTVACRRVHGTWPRDNAAERKAPRPHQLVHCSRSNIVLGYPHLCNLKFLPKRNIIS